MPKILTSRQRWIVPTVIAAGIAAAVLLPPAASAALHPDLPVLTAAQLLVDLDTTTTPDFSGTVVVTANLGLPALPTTSFASTSGAQLQQLETLLVGSHTIKIAYGGKSKQRVAVILSDLSESDVVHNGPDLWTYSSVGDAVTHTSLPADAAGKDATVRSAAPGAAATPSAVAQQALNAVTPSTTVTVDTTAVVAGRPTYQLVLAPKDPTSLIGSVKIAMDSVTHMPLRTQIFAVSNPTTAAFQVAFTDLTVADPPASTFTFTTPPGATVSPIGGGTSKPAADRPQTTSPAESGSTTSGTGWTTVAAGPLPASLSGAQSATGGRQTATSQLDDLLTPVAGGRALNTALVSVLLTDDGRYLVGAVTPATLDKLAAKGLGR